MRGHLRNKSVAQAGDMGVERIRHVTDSSADAVGACLNLFSQLGGHLCLVPNMQRALVSVIQNELLPCIAWSRCEAGSRSGSNPHPGQTKGGWWVTTRSFILREERVCRPVARSLSEVPQRN